MNKRGFTLVELAVVIGIFTTLMGFIVLNLVRSQQTASLTATSEILLSDIKQQQMKSMVGDTEGRADAGPYGIHFDANKYILFPGASYSPLESSNFEIDLPSNMQFNSANYDIIFSRVSGEISLPAIIELQDNTNSNLKRIYLNAYGTITQVE